MWSFSILLSSSCQCSLKSSRPNTRLGEQRGYPPSESVQAVKPLAGSVERLQYAATLGSLVSLGVDMQATPNRERMRRGDEWPKPTVHTIGKGGLTSATKYMRHKVIVKFMDPNSSTLSSNPHGVFMGERQKPPTEANQPALIDKPGRSEGIPRNDGGSTTATCIPVPYRALVLWGRTPASGSTAIFGEDAMSHPARRQFPKVWGADRSAHPKPPGR
ncbi:hypothetical protein PG985_007871 [Apiospora marii]|uniref:uncharacterized protein n=1 Tax=Apiospora marii TaxID=335849 RepID=UPI00312D9455